MITVNIYATGSSGNTTILTDTKTKRSLVIDCGSHPPPRLKYENIDGVLITHSHRDHMSMIRLYKDKQIYGSYSTLTCDWVQKKAPEGKFTYMLPEYPYVIGPFVVTPYTAQHDANDPYHYRINTDEDSIWYGCDAYCYNDTEYKAAIRCRRILIDSNYDERMINSGKYYPQHVKDRIVQSGHASNQYIYRRFKGHFRQLVICHMSPNHNSLEMVRDVFGKRINIAPKVLR